jgi:hypothetical protein
MENIQIKIINYIKIKIHGYVNLVKMLIEEEELLFYQILIRLKNFFRAKIMGKNG